MRAIEGISKVDFSKGPIAELRLLDLDGITFVDYLGLTINVHFFLAFIYYFRIVIL
jgi:hypothetical protein